ncbi:uncharacterized protein B0I36DRAFT_356983 [Microdochium trichocladiopsis]|uniref:Uncharacterized protein n=1 Tax=Microdochium trichocladiopsis TaxID=1682393 RepID=A0A9P8YHZ2_9PEZI|nr:uncharacterized protein B0I36DRAFT_356983 [Microdochium trichocladiopsis]KAH7039571.1 hypothetical protein B0I36DRAFT_356983 [Microdochium trichocladiopsis]
MSDALGIAPSEDSLSVVVKDDFEYYLNDKRQLVLKDKATPEDLIRGAIKIAKGEHGWLVKEKDGWALCRFLRAGHGKNLFVPRAQIDVGVPLKTLSIVGKDNSAADASTLAVHGRNAIIPLFESVKGRTYIMFRASPTAERPATVMFKTAITLHKLGKTKQYSCTVAPHLNLVIPQEAVNAGGLNNKRALLCFEVTEDGSRHPYAWHQASEVGLFENNSTVSRLAVRLEYPDQSDGQVEQWKSIYIFASAVVGHDAATGKKPKAWIKAWKVLMLLMRWRLREPTEWFTEAEYPMGELQELVYNHHTLTMEWKLITSPKKIITLPRLAQYKDNALAVTRLFPDHWWGKKPDIAFRAGSKDWSRESCDPCFLQGRSKDKKGGTRGKCVADDSNINTCTKCIIKYNRPCLWMYPEEVETLSLEQRRRMMDEGEDHVYEALPCHAPAGGIELLDTLDAVQERNEKNDADDKEMGEVDEV